MNYIIFDLEATCWAKEEAKDKQSEVIEIGAVKLDDNLNVVSEFQTFVKPSLNPILSEFCTNLTSIKQVEVDLAPTSKEALTKFYNWLSDNGKSKYWLCSWGFYDKKMLNRQCQMNYMATGWLKWHISIKHQYAEINGITPTGMKGILDSLGIELEGTHHRGIDDARNITKIFIKVFNKLTFRF
jgi:3'-5' exoribonuclease 1